MGTYLESLSTKQYTPNVVILLNGVYQAIREPDSGLTLLPEYKSNDGRGLLANCIINPTEFDLRQVSTTVSSNSFKLADKNLAITRLIKDRAQDFVGKQVQIFIGRTGVGMDFADYLPLAPTIVNKVDRQDNFYSFATEERTKRIDKPIYQILTRLDGAILSSTTTSILVKDDISSFPASGIFKIDDEFIGYDSKNDSTKQFFGLVRGVGTSIPANHDDNVDILFTEKVTGNPIDILLKLLISKSGTNVNGYDVLVDGCGIDESLIDVSGMQTIRDAIFMNANFDLTFYKLSSALTTIETEILGPCNLRFTFSLDAKLTIAVLDKAVFVDEEKIIDANTVTREPTWSVDSNYIVNEIDIDWGFHEGKGIFQNRSVYKDEQSISDFGLQQPISFSFKGPTTQAFVDDFANRLLARLSNPTPRITVETQIDKSILGMADKVILQGLRVPASNGTLQFAQELEILSRAINHETGDVKFKLAFTSFTDVRSCYIAPSDTINAVNSQSEIELAAGRGDAYEIGWVMRLWDNLAGDYTADPVNTILDITGDVLTFENNWATPLVANQHRIKFCDYDDASENQKRYCFIADNLLDFPDNTKSYKII